MEDFPQFLIRVVAEAQVGRADVAVAEVRDRMRIAESHGHLEWYRGPGGRPDPVGAVGTIARIEHMLTRLNVK